MYRVVTAVLLIIVSSCTYGGAQEALLTKEDINRICKIDDNSIEYSKGGFPGMVDKYSVNVRDKKCNIKINYRIYDFSLKSEAMIKLHELVAVDKSLGIPLEPTNGDPNYYTWEHNDRKLMLVRIKGNYVFSVAVNVGKELFTTIKQLIFAKYDEL